ncbi:MAG: hypothetical protein RL538_855 [Candidatus Parcubacteria bacterium]|jgi:hypothetical protein
MDEQTTVSCKDRVMNRIECEHICPRSKTFFKTRECAVWGLWGLSVVIGALAVAVTLFVVAHRQYALYEATHDNFFTFMVDVLPYLWIIMFALMVGVAVYNLRHTKGGYRYPLWKIFGSSMVLSLAGGTGLHLLGMGYTVDHGLGMMGIYPSEEKKEMRMWQNPDDGRLLGKVSALPLPPEAPGIVTFTDVSGKDWKVDVSDLAPHELDLLANEENVRLIGVMTEGDMLFHSCGAFPWLLDKPVRREDLEAARVAFEDKIHGYEERLEEKMPQLRGFDDEEGETEELKDDDSPCATIAPVKRMRRGEE